VDKPVTWLPVWRLPEGDMAIRDTKNRAGAVLSFNADAGRAFLADVRQDQR
jgi:Domain of unknown function (DUF397)